jgi:hypothetical protein
MKKDNFFIVLVIVPVVIVLFMIGLISLCCWLDQVHPLIPLK